MQYFIGSIRIVIKIMIEYSSSLSSVCIFAVVIGIGLIKGSNQIADIPLVSPIADSLLQSDECTTDLTNLLDVDLENIPTEFVTCVKDVEALKNKTHPDANKNTVIFSGFYCMSNWCTVYISKSIILVF